MVASSIFHYTFSRFSEIERASRSFAKTGLSFCCFLALFFEVVSRTAFGPQNFQLFKLKSDFDLLLEAFRDPFGTILGTFWQHVWQVVLASIFDAFSMRLNLAFLILVNTNMHFSHFRQGRCWHRFWLPKPSQNGPKTVPRRSQKDPKGFSRSL